jgi:hypothetical protein
MLLEIFQHGFVAASCIPSLRFPFSSALGLCEANTSLPQHFDCDKRRR